MDPAFHSHRRWSRWGRWPRWAQLGRAGLVGSLIAIGAGLVGVIVVTSGGGTPQIDLNPLADLAQVLPTATVLADASTLTNCLAADDSSIYWQDDSNGGSILKVAKTGGAVSIVAMGGVDKRACAVVDGTDVYFTTVGATAITKAPKAGGGAQTSVATGQNVLGPLALEGGFVWWATDVYGAVDAFNGMNAVVRAPVGGLTGATEVMYNAVVGNVSGLKVSASTIFVSDAAGVYGIDRNSMTKLSYGMSSVHNNLFDLDSQNLVMVEVTGFGAGGIVSYRLDGTNRKVLTKKLATLLFLDGTNVFAKENADLVRIPLDGTGLVPVAAEAPRAIVVDQTKIYFTDGTHILSLAK